jgi:hypothetical protein
MIYDTVTWEYGSSGNFSFMVCKKMAGIASALIPSQSCQGKSKKLFYTGWAGMVYEVVTYKAGVDIHNMLHCTECLIIRNVCNTSERDH